MMNLKKTSLFILTVLLILAAPGALSQTREPLDVMVPMRDGVRLSTLVYFPEGPMPEGGWPAVLHRTPYRALSIEQKRELKVVPFLSIEEVLAEGYVAVIQDVRGFNRSEGETAPFRNDGWAEHRDGYDTLEWLAAQAWCNGKVATAGGSAGGITQYQLAGAVSPHHVAMLALVASADNYSQALYPGGVFRYHNFLNWAKRADPRSFETFTTHYTKDAYWQDQDFGTRYAVSNVPGFHIAGWFDHLRQGALKSFPALQTNGQPNSQGKQKLLVGPWLHGYEAMHSNVQGEVTFPENAGNYDFKEATLKWLRCRLKDDKAAGDAIATVRYYVMGAVGEPGAPGNVWRDADTWPIPGTKTKYYFHHDGLVSTEAPTVPRALAEYDYDPQNPVPTIGGSEGPPIKHPFRDEAVRGPCDQRRIETRPDVLVFSTAPLPTPVEATGPVFVTLWAASDRIDTDFTAKLTDVYPDGRSMLITDGIIRTRFRDGFEEEKLMVAGKVYEFEIDLWQTSYVFNAGHRIRVAISSSNYPRFEANPNNGEPHWQPGEPSLVAHNTVYLDRTRPSHLLLNIVASGKGKQKGH